jgi:alpha-D-ribose 1-methylphosphonate 5-triphosphate synthase subunit PhnH
LTAPPALLARLDALRSQAAFRVLLDAISRPGTIHRLPAPWGGAIVPLALAEVETTIAVVGDDDRAEQVRRATGATFAPLDEAELVACDGRQAAATVARLRRGSGLAPELGAKVGIDCRALRPDAGEVTLALRGPGVPGRAGLGVDGVPPGFFRGLAAANRDAPAGIDVWLVDRDGWVAALPRTCHVEVH